MPGASVLPFGRTRGAGFSTYFGLTIRALGTVDEDVQRQIRADLEAAFNRYNRATDGTPVIENTYLQTVMTRN